MNSLVLDLSAKCNMSKYETFLKTSIDNHEEFSKALSLAALEIRADELGIPIYELSMEKDSEAIEIMNTSLHSLSFLDGYNNNLVSHVNNVVNDWQLKQHALFFRGTRLPDADSSFAQDGVHTTPQLTIADAYAKGDVNKDTGIGRLLNSRQIGFVSAWAIPLNEKTYANFQYEDYIHGRKPDSSIVVNDLVQQLKSFVSENPSFNRENIDVASEGEKKFFDIACSSSQHYESITNESCHKKHTFFRTGNNTYLKVNLENPKWNQWAARIQEASLRDFYEVLPCEKVLLTLTNVASSFIEDPVKTDIVHIVKNWTQQELETHKNAPWEATCMNDVSLKDSPYINKRPYIKESLQVGSASSAHKALPPSIELLHNISNNIVLGKFDEAQQLMQDYDNNYQPQCVATNIKLFGADIGGSSPVIFELNDTNNNLEKTLHAAYKNNIDMTGIDLSYQNLNNMDLRNMNMKNANFNGSQLDGTRFTEGNINTILPGMIIEPKFSLTKKDVVENAQLMQKKHTQSSRIGITPQTP